MVVSVADPPKTDNVWTKRKAEHEQKEAEKKGEWSFVWGERKSVFGMQTSRPILTTGTFLFYDSVALQYV